MKIAGFDLKGNRHVCAFFRTRDEEYGVLLPLIKEGIERGEKAIQVIDPKRRKKHLRHLESPGIDVKGAQKSGQFEIWDRFEAYLSDGHFDKDRMLTFVQEVFERGRHQGFP